MFTACYARTHRYAAATTTATPTCKAEKLVTSLMIIYIFGSCIAYLNVMRDQVSTTVYHCRVWRSQRISRSNERGLSLYLSLSLSLSLSPSSCGNLATILQLRAC